MSIYGIFINESAGSNKTEIKSANSALQILYLHMLKFKYQPNKQGTSWIDTIREQQYQVQYICLKNKTVYNSVSNYDNLSKLYKLALKDACKETGINIKKMIGNDEIPDELSFDKLISRDYIYSYMLKYTINDTVINQIYIGMNKDY